MGRITTGIGLVSGINSKDIIDQLMSLEARGKTQLENRVKSTTAQKTAYKALVEQLTKIQGSGRTLVRPTTFGVTTTSSSDEGVLTATTSAGAPVGTYQFQVARLVTSQQSVSKGFSDYTTAPVGTGTITVEMGGGEISSQTLLSELNGGAGVRRGQFRITDRTGASAVVDISNAVTVDDVVKQINTQLDIRVRASISGDRLVIADTTGENDEDLSITDLADGFAATDLGIAGSTAGNTRTGNDIHYLGVGTAVSELNDGLGIRTNPDGADFTLTSRDNTTFDIDLGAAKTVGEVLNIINTATAGKIKADIVPGGNGIRLTDLGSGGSANDFTVTAIAGSTAAQDLGILGVAQSGSVIDGNAVMSGINTISLATLNGGAGLTLGTIRVTNRAGATTDIDLAGATSVQGVLDLINDAGAGVRATLNDAGNGFAITDTSGGTGNLTIADEGATTTATLLGLNQSVDTSKTKISGKNLQRKWVNENTLLSKFNGGRGVTPGTFKITNAAGAAKEFNLGQATNLGEVISAINSANMGVTAAINANGDGLLLTDTTGGANKLKVENVTGTTASDLNIAGTATLTTIDGSFEKSLILTSSDTLTTVQQKITTMGFGVKASIINDGSAGAPYRLSLNAVNTGRAGRVTLDMGTTDLAMSTLVQAQDAAVFVGGTGSPNPLLVTASGNSMAGVLPGVTLNLNSISDKPVTLSITRDVENIVEEVQKFSDNFNEMIQGLKELTKFDPDTNEKGLLLGDGTARTIETEMYAALQVVVSGAGRYRIFADVGVTLTNGAEITFDEEKFRKAYADDPEAVKNLFTQTEKGLGAVIEKRMAKLIDPVDGAVTRHNKQLDTRNEQFNSRIKSIDRLLEQKRARLEKQFASMESVLAKLQTQQTSLATLANMAASI